MVLPSAAVAVTVTDCTTAGYNNYTLGTPNDIGLGGALAHGNAITVACNAALSGGSGPYTIVPQNATTTGAQEITLASGTLSIDGSDGGRHDIILSGNNTIPIFGLIGGTLDLTYLTLADGNSPGQFGAGGAIFNNGGSVTIAQSTIRNNSAGLDGGAIFTHSPVTIIDSTFSKNMSSGAGGAIANFAGGTVTVINSTFSGNSATITGGGIFNADRLTITNSTFDGNTAERGGGIFFNGGAVTLANTILANGGCGGSVSLTDNGGNLEYPSNTCGFTVANGDSLSDPKLGALASNGGPTQTEALGAGSAAINLGLIATCTASPVNGIDQRGYLRPTSGACDSGAYDSHGTQPGTTTTLSVTQPASPPVTGQSFTLVLTAQVADPGYPAPSQVTPTGTVTFYQGVDNTGPVLACQEGDPTTHAVPLPDTTAPEAVTCTVPTQRLLASGSPYHYTAVYSGDSTFTGSTSNTVAVTVSKADTTTTITTLDCTATPVFGQPITCAATVTVNAPGSGTPTGTLTFYAESTSSTAIGSCTLNQGSPDTCAFSPGDSSLAVGGHTIYAVYSGDTNFNGSQGSTPLTVSKANTQTVVTLAAGSTNPTNIGQSVTYVATVSVVAPGAGTPTGTVSFTDNGNPIPGCTNVPLVTPAETASCTTSYPASQVGSHSIVATYSGDGNFNGSSGSFIELVQGCSVTSALRVGNQALGVVTHDDNPATPYPIHFLSFAGGSGVGTFTARDPVITLCTIPVTNDAGAHGALVVTNASATIVGTVSTASTPSAFGVGDTVSVTVRLVNGQPGPATITNTTTGATYTMNPPYRFGSYLRLTTP